MASLLYKKQCLTCHMHTSRLYRSKNCITPLQYSVPLLWQDSWKGGRGVVRRLFIQCCLDERCTSLSPCKTWFPCVVGTAMGGHLCIHASSNKALGETTCFRCYVIPCVILWTKRTTLVFVIVFSQNRHLLINISKPFLPWYTCNLGKSLFVEYWYRSLSSLSLPFSLCVIIIQHLYFLSIMHHS